MRGLRVTILGAGTAVPAASTFPSGVLVQSARTTVLVDAGPGVLRRLPDVGVGLEDLDAVLLTHRHLDHTADLAALLFALNNPRYEGRSPLVVRGGPWLTELLAGIRLAWPRWTEPRDYVLDIVPTAPGSFDVGGIEVSAVAVTHAEGSLAYRLAAGGATVAISGDVDTLDGLADVARGADLFVCEAALPPGLRRDRHLTARMAGRAARAAGCRALCLTHLYPECAGTAAADMAREEFAGRVVVAHDLLRFDLPGPEAGTGAGAVETGRG